MSSLSGTIWACLVLVVIFVVNSLGLAWELSRPRPVAKIGFEAAGSAGREGETLNVRVELAEPLPFPTRARLRVDGTAQATDISMNSRFLRADHDGWELTVPAGFRVVVLPILLCDDKQAEQPAERILLQLSGDSGRVEVGPIDVHELTIQDPYLPPSLHFVFAELPATREGDVVRLEVRAEGMIERPFSVPVSVAANSSRDIQLSTHSLDFGPEKATASLEITAVSDSLYEGDERATITLVKTPGTYVLGEPHAVELPLEDADQAPTFRLAGPATPIMPSMPCRCELFASVASSRDRDFECAVVAPKANSGALPLGLPTTLKFELRAGKTQASADLPLAGVDWQEGDTQLTIDLPEDERSASPADRRATVTIRNLRLLLRISPSEVALKEGTEGTTTLTIEFEDAAAAPLDLDIKIRATGSAALDDDYQVIGIEPQLEAGSKRSWNGVLRFPRDGKQIAFELRSFDDKVDEDDKEVSLSFESIGIDNRNATPVSRIKLCDDDPSPIVRLSAEPLVVNEGATLDVKLRFENAVVSERPISGKLEFGGSLRRDQDFRFEDEFFVFQPGEQERSIEIQTLDDNKRSPNGQRGDIKVSLAALKNAEASADAGSLRIEVNDDDSLAGSVLVLVAHTDEDVDSFGGRQALAKEMAEFSNKHQNVIVLGVPQLFGRTSQQPYAADDQKDEAKMPKRGAGLVLQRALEIESDIIRRRNGQGLNVILVYPHNLETGQVDQTEPFEKPKTHRVRRKVIVIGAIPNQGLAGDFEEILKHYSTEKTILTVSDVREEQLATILANCVEKLEPPTEQNSKQGDKP
jgi:hypothetical protein